MTAHPRAGTVGSSTTSKATSGSTPTRSDGGSRSTPTSSGSGPRPGRTAPREAATQRAHRQGGGGHAGRRRPRYWHLHVEGHLQQLPGHHRRRRRDDQHRHALRGAGDQAALRGREQQPTPGDRVHPGSLGSCRWMVAASTDPGWRPSRRRTTPTSASTGGACSRSSPAAPRSSGAAISRSFDRSYQPPEPVVTTTFLDTHAFTLGGRRFELYATPGGETTDSLVVWLPEDRTVFTGNLMGPLFGHVPNLYTVRGDKIRSAIAYVHAVDRVIGLDPEVLVTGHGEPIRGADEIRRRLSQLRDATQYLRDRTIEGMNSGVDLFTLMGSDHAAARARHPAGARQGAMDRARGLGGARRLVPLRVDHRALRRPAVRDLGRAHRARRRHRRC